MSNRLQPEMEHYGDNRRFAIPVTPYRRGFEDALYDRVYANPFAPRSEEARRYDAGNQDARHAVTERTS